MEFSKFLLELIREGGKPFQWMEERRLEWGPLVYSRIKALLEGKCFLLSFDDERAWFETYFLSLINANENRPKLPFISLRALCPKICENKDDIALLNDMLDFTFPQGYIHFYVGRADKKQARVVLDNEDSMLWLFDEEVNNSFYLSSFDNELDFKLISLFKLLDACLDGLLFSKFKTD